MASTPPTEQPGFERDENELPEDQENGAPDTLEDGPDAADKTDIGTDNDGQNRDDEQPQQGGYQ